MTVRWRCLSRSLPSLLLSAAAVTPLEMSSPYFALSVYSAAIVVVPISVFFLTKRLTEALFSAADANIAGAIASVIAVHIVLFAFVFKAFREEKTLARQRLHCQLSLSLADSAVGALLARPPAFTHCAHSFD